MDPVQLEYTEYLRRREESNLKSDSNLDRHNGIPEGIWYKDIRTWQPCGLQSRCTRRGGRVPYPSPHGSVSSIPGKPRPCLNASLRLLSSGDRIDSV